MSRIFVIGSGGAGKTTVAAYLAEHLKIQNYQLDTYFWNDNWIPASQEVFISRVDDVLGNRSWIVDGVYRGPIFDRVYEEADTIVWLNLPLYSVIFRSICRNMKMFLSRANYYGKDCVPTFLGGLRQVKYIYRTFAERNTFLEVRVTEASRNGKLAFNLEPQKQIDSFLKRITDNSLSNIGEYHS